MAEHRLMSADHLGLTHYRSRRCYESHPNCQRWSARSRYTKFTTRSPESCECLRKSELETQLCSRQTGQLRLIRDHGLLMLGVHLKSAIAYPKSPCRISRKYHSLLGNIMGKPCCITGECKRRDGCSGKTTARSPDSLGKRAQILFPAWRTADGTPLAPLRNNERF